MSKDGENKIMFDQPYTFIDKNEGCKIIPIIKFRLDPIDAPSTVRLDSNEKIRMSKIFDSFNFLLRNSGNNELISEMTHINIYHIPQDTSFSSVLEVCVGDIAENNSIICDAYLIKKLVKENNIYYLSVCDEGSGNHWNVILSKDSCIMATEDKKAMMGYYIRTNPLKIPR